MPNEPTTTQPSEVDALVATAWRDRVHTLEQLLFVVEIALSDIVTAIRDSGSGLTEGDELTLSVTGNDAMRFRYSLAMIRMATQRALGPCCDFHKETNKVAGDGGMNDMLDMNILHLANSGLFARRVKGISCWCPQGKGGEADGKSSEVERSSGKPGH